MTKSYRWAVIFVVVALLISANAHASASSMLFVRTPNGGIQPQAIIDRQNVIHLIYYVGDPAHGDIYYVRGRVSSVPTFSDPIRVNSQPNTAMAMGTIRGAQLALGRNGRIYVTWNGVGAKGANGYSRLSIAFTRLSDDKTHFDPQRNLLPESEEVDGGGSVAADQKGNVYVVWHNNPPGLREAAGGVFLVRSSDDGITFSAPQSIGQPAGGQCGCCSMKAFATRTGAVYVFYRSAGNGIHRDATLVLATNSSLPSRAIVEPWTINACPMSFFSLSDSGTGVLAAWETMGQVSFATFEGLRKVVTGSAPGIGRRKYPVAIQGEAGDILLEWVEGAGWGHGGTLQWQMYDQQANAIGSPGSGGAVSTWSLPTAVTTSDGQFVTIY